MSRDTTSNGRAVTCISTRFHYRCITCHLTDTFILYITCNLAEVFIQSDLQLIRLSRRQTPWSNVGLRALLKGPTAVQILSWPHQGSNHQPCVSKSSSLTTTLQTGRRASGMQAKSACMYGIGIGVCLPCV